MKNNIRYWRVAGLLLVPLLISACEDMGSFPDQENVCTFDSARESARAASAASFPAPVIQTLLVNGTVAWTSATPTSVPAIKPGDTITLRGSGFGNGTDIDFAKIMIGNSRVLETDLAMYQQKMDINKQVNFEKPTVTGTWPKDVKSWSDNEVVFTVPVHVSAGPIRLQVQKRIGYNDSLRHGGAHNVIDAQTSRVTDPSFAHDCDVVSQLSPAKGTTPIPVTVTNPNFGALVAQGRRDFWGWDYNLGLAHHERGMKWDKIFGYQAYDPFTRGAADPAKLFGAVKTVSGEVPAEAINDITFDLYPMQSPIPGFLGGAQLTGGKTKNSGWAGYRYAESSDPYTGNGSWIGFNCASCHGYRVSYQKGTSTIAKVIPGLPNPSWTMKWAAIGDKILSSATSNMDSVDTSEPGPSWAAGNGYVDKTMLLWYMPGGAGEHTLIRNNGEGSLTDNDYQFSPIAIPNVTHYTSIRRSLSHTESYVGFEGSYIHSEEPDGAMGNMRPDDLKALTAYMTTLDANDDDLRNVGMYRWLKARGKLAQTGNTALAEGAFVQAGWRSYGGVMDQVVAGKAVFDRDCGSCHNDTVGANTSERMFRLSEVGRFFEPTVYQRDTQSIRATFLRDEYWVQSRGLLSDGHVRNLEDLVNPDRCTEGTALYNQYYTLHAAARPALGSPDQPAAYPDLNRKGDVFRVPRSYSLLANDSGDKRNRFIERHNYFVRVSWDSNNYYWDYQKMRREYGPKEMGTAAPIGMPAAPHPWCAASKTDVDALVEYVLTL